MNKRIVLIGSPAEIHKQFEDLIKKYGPDKPIKDIIDDPWLWVKN